MLISALLETEERVRTTVGALGADMIDPPSPVPVPFVLLPSDAVVAVAAEGVEVAPPVIDEVSAPSPAFGWWWW